MLRKYLVPAGTMLIGLAVWVVLLVLNETVDSVSKHPIRIGVVLCLVAGVLFVFSALRCRQADGPWIGLVIRTALLIVMAGITWWRVSIVGAIVLLAAAIPIVFLASSKAD